MATMRNASNPSRNVTTNACNMVMILSPTEGAYE
jgi:hypothetical protein